ncbi:MAG TPA: chloride channel protein [Gemmatimonadales bacterium]
MAPPILNRLVDFGARLGRRVPVLLRATSRLDESTVLMAFAVAIGSAVGLAVVLFYTLIDVTQAVALSAAAKMTGVGQLSIVVVVFAGLSIAFLLVRHLAGDSDGENIPDVMRAVVKRGGHLNEWRIAVKTAAAGILIGTGGAVGAEGPVAVAGAALGSRFGRVVRSSGTRLTVLVACGSAAGISAAFNAPIAGVFFSLEKILGTFAVGAFPPVLVASVISAAISRAAFGNSPVIEIPTEYAMSSVGELWLYAALGIAAGVVSVLYTRGVYGTVDQMAKLRSRWLQIAVAAVVVGTLNIVFRAALWGRGHESLTLGMIGQREAYFLVALAFAKLVATSFTLATARAGGVFTPALFIGATLGGGLAVAAEAALPTWAIRPEAFALAGMAGLVAGATHAPLTAIMIVFEMSGDYALILPIMLTAAISYITAKRLYPESVYSAWLTRRGERIGYGRDISVLEQVTVREVYRPNPDVIAEDASLPGILAALGRSTQTEFPVLDADGRLVGMIAYNDIRTVLGQVDSLAPVLVAADIANAEAERVTPADSLATALRRFSVRGIHAMPVVEESDEGKLLGMISRHEVFAAYDRELLRRSPDTE